MKRSTRILIAIFVMSLLFAGSEELKQVQEGMSLGGIYEKEIQEFAGRMWTSGPGEYVVMKKMSVFFPVSTDSAMIEKDKFGFSFALLIFLAVFFGLSIWAVKNKKWEWMLAIVPIFIFLALPVCFFLIGMGIHHSSRLIWLLSFLINAFVPSSILLFFCLKDLRILFYEKREIAKKKKRKRIVTAY